MNSILQILFSYDNAKDHFLNLYESHHATCQASPSDCYTCQISKLAMGMFSGKYSHQKEIKLPDAEGAPEEEKGKTDIYQEGIKPQMFKNLIGKGHVEFSSPKQQDAQEYFNYLLDKIVKGEKQS